MICRDDRFDHEQHAFSRHRGAAAAKNRQCALVVPVVNDLLDQIDVTTARDAFEEVAARERAAFREALGRDPLARGTGQMRLVEQHASGAGQPREQGEQKGAEASAYVDDRALAEAPGIADGAVFRRAATRHRRVEHGADVGMAREVLEVRHPEHRVEGRRSGANAVREALPRAPVRRFAEHQREGAQRIRCVSAQARRQWRRADSPVVVRVEDADADERAQQTPERCRVRGRRRGERADRHAAATDPVGQAELRGDMHRLREPCAGEDPEQRRSGG